MTDAQIAVYLKLPSVLVKYLRQRNFDAAIEEIRRIKERCEDYTKAYKAAPLKSPVKSDIVTAAGEDISVKDYSEGVSKLTSNLSGRLNINKKTPRWVIEARLNIKNLKEHVIKEEDNFNTQKIYKRIEGLTKQLGNAGFKP